MPALHTAAFLFSLVLFACIGEALIVTRTITTFEREYWMRRALQTAQAVGQPAGILNPCIFGPYGALLVNHSVDFNRFASINDSIEGIERQFVCGGASQQGSNDPTGHGELEAIRNCARQFPSNGFNYAGFWQFLTLYTTAESCPMCASAARWARVGGVVWSISIPRLLASTRPQIRIRSAEVNFQSAADQNPSWAFETEEIGEFLVNIMGSQFDWQFNASAPCPTGCYRSTVIHPNGRPLCLPNPPYPPSTVPQQPTVQLVSQTKQAMYIRVFPGDGVNTVEVDCGFGFVSAVKLNTLYRTLNNVWVVNLSVCDCDAQSKFNVIINTVQFFIFGLPRTLTLDGQKC
eukprot:TRINITY_DN832_c0_g3_i1.p1 TRINITY_DN832_c0_g3~~TRINITY_DN832_c0_g3_i1.p1  ORF type:complete len:347 (+),score=35.41 TRINITY_DN832_c0_g3_i1:52-1092(+)